MTKGYFLSFEGIEGSGKTTQIQRLAQHLRAAGRNCVTTREPGGTQLADRIRAILLDPQEEGMDPISELFLYAASRRQHVVEVIKPSLETGAIVLCDRFSDASIAYQGYGRMLDLNIITQLNDWATEGSYPDLTLIFDLPESAGLDRAKARNSKLDLQRESRLEGEDLRFHRRVREGYLVLAEAHPERYEVVDATGTPDDVFANVLSALGRRAGRLNIS